MTLTRSLVGTALGLAALAASSLLPTPKAAPSVARTSPPPAVTPRVAPPSAADPVTAESTGPLTVQGRLSSTSVLTGVSETHLVIDLAAPQTTRAERKPVNMAVVIDRSGSMCGRKVEDAKNAAGQLVEQLRPSDRLAIVQYGDNVVYSQSRLADPAGKAQMHHFIQQVSCDGSTDIGQALRIAETLVHPFIREYASTRIVLLTDGEPTTGIVNPEQLGEVAAAIHRQGVAVTSLGLGSDINERLMRLLAERGAGFYGFLENASQLEAIFSHELREASEAVARNVEVKLRLAPGVELVDIVGHPMVRVGNTVTTSLYDLSAGLSARLVARLRVSADAERSRMPLADVEVAYTEAKTQRAQQARLAMAADVTSRPEVVAAHVDAEAESGALRARAGEQIEKAAEAFRSGDRTGALSIMESVRTLFGNSAYALASDRAAADDYRQRFAHAGTNEGAKVANTIQSRNLANFGTTNTY